MSVKREIPFDGPPQTASPPTINALSAEQQEKYDAVLQRLQEIKGLPTDSKTPTPETPLLDSEKAWLSRECILRYMRATKWNTALCYKRIVSTLVWRRTFGVDPRSNLTPDMVSFENETGKEYVFGYDNDCRPCLYLRPGRQNTKASPTQVQHLVFMLERVINFMVPDQDQLALVIDFQGLGFSNNGPSLSTGREVLNILQDHYPERLGKALLTNMPRVARIFLRLIHPFIDPLTREKLVFDEPFLKYVSDKQLQVEYGGVVEFDYSHKTYWPTFVEMALARHDYYLARWRELSNSIGHSESELRKGFKFESATAA